MAKKKKKAAGVAVGTAQPTGLSITRSGANFTFAWKIGDENYSSGQWLCYNTNDGGRTGWIGLDPSQTSLTLTLGAVRQVAFWVKGVRAPYEVKTTTKKKTTTTKYVPVESAESVCDWRASVPQIKSLNYSRSAANRGSFSWDVSTNDTGTDIFSYVELQTTTSRGNENPPGSGWSSQTKGSSGSYDPGAETLGGSNLVRWVRVRAVGPAGASGWSYSHHAYGNPSTPTLDSASGATNGTSTRITASWRGPMSLSYPIDTITVQYVFAKPTDSSFSAPATGWSDAISVSANGGADKVVVNIADAIDTDECMWVRLKATHDESSLYSNARLAQIGTLATPGINATPNVTTGDVAITITEATNCTVAGTVIFYRSEKRPEYDQVVAVLAHGTTSTTVHIDEIMTSYEGHVDTSCFGAYAYVGTHNGLSVSARMRSGVAVDSDILARPPAWLELSEGSKENSVRIKWPWSWSTATSAELAWADHDDAWESTDEPSYYAIDDKTVMSWIIASLDVGKRWYFRVRLKLDDGEDVITGPWSETYDYDLSSIPDKPALILSKSVIGKDDSVTARWAYSSADDTSQEYADICVVTISAGVITYGNIIAHVSEGQTVEITGNWTTGTTYYFCLRLTSTSGRQSEWSDPAPLFIAPQISLSVTQKSLSTVSDLLYLTEMPLTVTMTGAGVSGRSTVSIIRAEDYHIVRPDGSDFDGFEGENIVSKSQTGESQMTITVDDLVGYLDDGAKYILRCTITDEYGQTASTEFPFTVDWSHQAGKPSAEVTIDEWQRIAIIKPIAPSNYESGDVADIYRISADKPELIVKGAAFGTQYVDPYPAFGEFCGHRIVTRTANGDYITPTNELAWFLADSDIGDMLDEEMMVIDVDGEQIELPYKIQLQNSWVKDFKRTSYLGGAVQGDWNPAVTRDLTANTTIVRGDDLDEQIAMRGLAGYAGPAHIRTPDGSSVTCNIEVRESSSYDSMEVSYTLAIKVIDPQQPDGMTYEQWKNMHPIG